MINRWMTWCSDKPHIERVDVKYRCCNFDGLAYGRTPHEAYLNWSAYMERIWYVIPAGYARNHKGSKRYKSRDSK